MRLYNWNEFSQSNIPDIEFLCRKYSINNYTINSDGSIDVQGNVNLHNKNLTEIPLKFRNVTGYFWCSENHLTSLDGCPDKVGGLFRCDSNQLTSLEGSPKELGGGFYCSSNFLTDLKGINVDVIDGPFICSSNLLKSLEGCPKEIRDIFACRYNLLTDLKGSPKIVTGKFDCSENEKLTTLEGNLESVGGDFVAYNCKLESFKGLPIVYGGLIKVPDNNIWSTEGFCEFYNESMSVECHNNPINEILKFFYTPYRFDGLYWMERMQVIRPGKKLDYLSFCDVFDEIGYDPPSLDDVEKSVKSYRII